MNAATPTNERLVEKAPARPAHPATVAANATKATGVDVNTRFAATRRSLPSCRKRAKKQPAINALYRRSNRCELTYMAPPANRNIRCCQNGAARKSAPEKKGRRRSERSRRKATGHSK